MKLIDALKGYDQQQFKTAIKVQVQFPGDKPFIDAIKGLNAGHAMMLAKQNWPGAQIKSLGPLKPGEELPPDPTVGF